MNKFLCGALALALTSCGPALFPKPITLMVAKVDLPASVGASVPMEVTVHYGVGCGDENQRLTVVSRTAGVLTLKASGVNRDAGLPCPAIYIERTLTYTDPGTPARTNPFEVVVNGKSWGKVEVR